MNIELTSTFGVDRLKSSNDIGLCMHTFKGPEAVSNCLLGD